MGTKKFTELTELAEAPADDDVLAIQDVSATATKKIQFSVLRDALGSPSAAKESVRVVSSYSTPASLIVGATVDGVTLVDGDRVLNRIGEVASDPGIWVVQASGAAVRATDFDSDEDAALGVLVPVREGDAYANSVWVLATPAPIVLGTTPIQFARVDLTELQRNVVNAIPQNQLFAVGLPTPDDDSTQGYTYGSLWVVPGMGALMCVDPAEAAAVWQVITNSEDPIPEPGANIAAVGRANSDGSDADYARVDHVHDGGLRAVAVKNSDFTLVGTDDVVFIETSGGSVVCGPDAALPSQGRSWVLKKTTSDENAITIQPPPGHSIEGGAADAAYVIPGSRATDNPAFLLVYQGGTTWWVLPHLGNKGELHLRELLTDPTNGITDTGILYVKDVGDATHLFYKPNIGAAVQITQAGGLIAHGVQAGGTLHAEATKDAAGFLSAIHYDQLDQGKKSAIMFDDDFTQTLTLWAGNTSGAGASTGVTAVSGRLSGWLYLGTGTTAAGYASLRSSVNMFYGGPFQTIVMDSLVELVGPLPDGTDNYRVLVALVGLTDPTALNGFSFTYDHAVSPNWQVTKWAAGVATHTDTGIPVAEDVLSRFAWSATGASTSTLTVEFFIDGVLVATLTNCVMSAAYAHPAMIWKTLGTTARQVRVDRSKCVSIFTSERA